MFEKLEFKIIGFTYFPNGVINDCIAILENGEKILVDPFVGNAYEYENREYLLDNWWDAEGHWFEHDAKLNIERAFLPKEGGLKIINIK